MATSTQKSFDPDHQCILGVCGKAKDIAWIGIGSAAGTIIIAIIIIVVVHKHHQSKIQLSGGDSSSDATDSF